MGDPRNTMDIKPGYRGRAFTSEWGLSKTG